MAARDIFTAFLAGAMGRRPEDMPSRFRSPEQKAAIAAGFTNVADWRADIERRRQQSEQQAEASLTAKQLENEQRNLELMGLTGLDKGEEATFVDGKRLSPNQKLAFDASGGDPDAVMGLRRDIEVLDSLDRKPTPTELREGAQPAMPRFVRKQPKEVETISRERLGSRYLKKIRDANESWNLKVRAFEEKRMEHAEKGFNAYEENLKRLRESQDRTGKLQNLQIAAAEAAAEKRKHGEGGLPQSVRQALLTTRIDKDRQIQAALKDINRTAEVQARIMTYWNIVSGLPILKEHMTIIEAANANPDYQLDDEGNGLKSIHDANEMDTQTNSGLSRFLYRFYGNPPSGMGRFGGRYVPQEGTSRILGEDIPLLGTNPEDY